jgi:hypothetical protein
MKIVKRVIWSYTDVLEWQAEHIYFTLEVLSLDVYSNFHLDSELNYVIRTVFSILFMIHIESIFSCEYINFYIQLLRLC